MVTRIAIALALCASACTHDQPVAAPKAGPSPEVVAASTDALGFLPVDADLVIGLNYGQLSQSPLFKDMLAMLNKPELAEMMNMCGVPTNMTVAGKGMNEESFMIVLVVRGMEKSKFFTTCLPELQKKEAAKGKGTTITVDGDTVLYTNKKGTGAGSFVTDNTFVMVAGPHVDRSLLQPTIAAGTPLRKSAAFAEMFGKVDTNRAVWGLASGKLALLKQLSAMGVTAQGLFGSIAVTDGVALDGRLRLSSADQASSLAALVKGQAAQAAAFVDKLDIGNDGNDVTFAVAMSADKLKAMIGMVAAQAGGGGGD